MIIVLTVKNFILVNAIKLFLPTGKVELIVGQDEVKSIFADEKTGQIVVLCDENIVKYGNVPYIAMQDYKAKKEE